MSFRLLSKHVKIKMQNYNLTCRFVLVWDLFCHTEGGPETEGFWEQGAWAQEGGRDRSLEKSAWWEPIFIELFRKI
jgi:hypothetical protein